MVPMLSRPRHSFRMIIVSVWFTLSVELLLLRFSVPRVCVFEVLPMSSPLNVDSTCLFVEIVSNIFVRV